MEQKKEEGTTFFKQGKWADAQASYEAALAQNNVPTDMQSVLLSNIAACQLKVRDFAGAVASCDRAMAMPNFAEPLMEKLLFRRAQGYMETDQLTASARDLKAALQLNPGNKAVAQLLRVLQEKARADASGVGKALKALKDSPSLDALRFLEFAPDASVYRDVLAARGESLLWKCVYTCEDRVVGAGAVRVLHKITASSASAAAAVLAAIDVSILTTFVEPPQIVDHGDKYVLETAVVGLCGALAASMSSSPLRRALVNAVLNGLRAPSPLLHVAALDELLGDLNQHAQFKDTLHELGLFPLLLSRADIFEESTVSRTALVFSQVLSAFEANDDVVARLVADCCILPIMEATSMAAASPAAVLLCAVFLVNAKLGGLAIQAQPHFFPHLSTLLLAHDTIKLAHQELVLDLVAFVAGSEAGVTTIPVEMRVELGKIMQADMDAKHMKLQTTAVAALVKMSVVEKTFDVESPMGHLMVDTVLDLLGRMTSTDPHRPALVGATAAERAVEALSFLITYTPVKDTLVQHKRALDPLLDLSSTTPSNMLYGIAYILHHLLTSEAHLKKQKMASSELTPDQYEQLQKALKQKSELDDGDTNAQIQTRLVAVLNHPTGIKTLVQLLKTKSAAVLEMAIQSALHASDCVEMRGKLVQGGVLAALFPRAAASQAAQQAIAKILITTNPNLIPSAQLLSAVQPLRTLCKHDSALLQFEALMALTNIASVSLETKARVLADQGLSAIQYLQFSDHTLVRRAATECLTNLLPHDDVLDKVFCQPDKMRLWIAFSSLDEAAEDFETARAASGALAMVTQYPAVLKIFLAQNPFPTIEAVLAQSTSNELVHRHLFAMQNCLDFILSSETTGEDAIGVGEKAMYEAQLLELGPTIETLATTTPAEIRPIAQACLDMLKKLDE
ncbi:Aste57867_10138 [Aphanomyces stellatus]|uniref:Aste57867_10138 protein n=1 Tax=Aphanomyces stellatus TaxID=120398 RepID=A0A485KQK1_9STRA|nr:hypothetical protein As57867_010099 [Aphanomyces stellatus]VFT87014.1 Aste57867_10138 [Aphanomyces stellatus]